MSYLNQADYKAVMNMRAVVPAPTNFVSGPFYLEAPIATGAATAFDLTVTDAWYADAQVRAVYGPANGGTARMQATFHLETCELLIVDGVFGAILSTLKDNLWSSYLYVQLLIAGQPLNVPLDEHITEVIAPVYWAATQLPATTFGSRVAGRPFVLPSPVDIDLNQDTFTLASVSDVAPGATTAGRLRCNGCLFPNNNPGSGSLHPGMASAGKWTAAAIEWQKRTFMSWRNIAAMSGRD